MLRASTAHSVGHSRLALVDVDGLPLPLPSQRRIVLHNWAPGWTRAAAARCLDSAARPGCFWWHRSLCGLAPLGDRHGWCDCTRAQAPTSQYIYGCAASHYLFSLLPSLPSIFPHLFFSPSFQGARKKS